MRSASLAKRLSRPGSSENLILLSLLFSGAASLAYEVLWIRILGELVGQTVYAVQVVLAVFFAGMGVGSALSDRWIRQERRLLEAYGVLQISLAAYGLLLWHLIRFAMPAYDALVRLAEPGLGYPLLASAALLLVPTALMGAAFPLVASWWRRRENCREVATVYSVNTLGGVLGTWTCAYWLIPSLGVKGALRAAALGSLVASGLAWTASRAGRTQPLAPHPVLPEPTRSSFSRSALVILLFCSGFIAVTLEVLWSRALEQVLSGTVFTFATVLGVLLVGLALGAGLYRQSLLRVPLMSLLVGLQLFLAAYVLASLTLIRLIPRICVTARSVLGSGLFLQGVAFESLVAGTLILLPATAMGLIFPVLLDLAPTANARRLGTLVAANTLGSLCGPLAAGFLLLPKLGLRASLGMVSWLALSMGLAVWGLARRSVGAWIPAIGITLCGLFAAIAPGGTGIFIRPSEELIAYIEDPAATVSVVRDPSGLLLKVNNSFYLGGDVGLETERRQGHLPMFLAGDPRRVLVLGFGTGATVGAISLHRPDRLVAVEIVSGILKAARSHFRASNEAILESSRTEVVCADALRFARTSRDHYEVVVGDLYHPWQAGVGALYSREHFEAVRRLLAPRGLFCQWLPLHGLTPGQLKIIIRTFLAAFPEDQAWLGNFGMDMPVLALIGSQEAVALDLPRWRAAAGDPRLARGLRAARFDVFAEIVGGYLGGRRGLERFAGTGPLNTQDDPLIEFGTPEIWRAGSDPSILGAFEKLLALDPDPVTPLQDRPDLQPELARKAKAAGQAVRAMVRARLRFRRGDPASAVSEALRAVRSDVDFEGPVDLLRELGLALGPDRPDLAREAFRELVRERPEDPHAFLSLGAASLTLRRPTEAADAFERALALKPGWDVARRGLSEADRQKSLPSSGPRFR